MGKETKGMTANCSAVAPIDKKNVMKRLLRIRGEILNRYPFYGQLLMRLQIGLADCQTAYTDMKHIVFDPAFVSGLSDEEVVFLMNHEALHCALKHCTRGANKHTFIYNIACDIVVNSLVMEQLGVTSFTLAGEEPMHLTPDGNEGRLYSAEQIYEMLMTKMDDLEGEGAGALLDNHGPWSAIDHADAKEDAWNQQLKEIEKGPLAGSVDMTQSLRHLLEEFNYESKLDWREILHAFVQLSYERFDYSFLPPDNRFCEADYALPSYCEVPEEQLKNLWFVVDTSGSISQKQLTTAYGEIKAATEQNHMSGILSFFDTQVTKPVPFSDADDLENVKIWGGGGTSFRRIFQYLADALSSQEIETLKEKPAAIIIITDGCAPIPEEEASMEIPVLWVICDSKVTPSWGTVIQI